MTHSKCGLLLLLATAGVVACGGDPTSSFREGAETIVATPSAIFVNEGASVFVIAERRDEQGNQLSADFEPADIGSTITVVRDTTFLETTNGTVLKTRDRFIVSGLQPGSTSFNITSGDLTLNVPVRVLPTAIPATFSTASPAINEPLTITLPAGYTFGADAAVESDLGAGLLQSIAADSTSLTVILIPGSAGPLTLSGVKAANLPGVPINLPTVDPISASSTPLAGTGSTATAPEIPVPALGATINFFDTGTLSNPDITGDGGLGAQYYKFVVTTAGDYHFVTNWFNTADLDAIVCFDPACSGGAFAGTGTTQPEDGTLTLTPGTYYYAVVLFAGSAPPYFQLTLSQVVPGGGD